MHKEMEKATHVDKSYYLTIYVLQQSHQFIHIVIQSDFYNR